MGHSPASFQPPHVLTTSTIPSPHLRCQGTRFVPESQAEATSAAHHMRFMVSEVMRTTTFLGRAVVKARGWRKKPPEVMGKIGSAIPGKYPHEAGPMLP